MPRRNVPYANGRSSHASYHDRAVLRAKAQAVAQSRFDALAPARIGDEIEVAYRVSVPLIDCRGEKATLNRGGGGDDASGTARALRVPDHRFYRRARESISVAPEKLAHAARF